MSKTKFDLDDALSPLNLKNEVEVVIIPDTFTVTLVRPALYTQEFHAAIAKYVAEVGNFSEYKVDQTSFTTLTGNVAFDKEFIAGVLIKDWKLKDSHGNKLKFTIENAREVFKNEVTGNAVYGLILHALKDNSTFAIDRADAIAKNL